MVLALAIEITQHCTRLFPLAKATETGLCPVLNYELGSANSDANAVQ